MAATLRLYGLPPSAGEGARRADEGGRRLILVLAFVLALVLPATAAEEIRSYDVAIVLAPDGSAEITETIAINAEGVLVRRGILLNLPKTVIGDDASIRQPTVTVLSVLRNGSPEPFALEDEPSFVRIRIGQADVFLELGIHTYVVRYRISELAGPSDSSNALAWEAIGTGWPFPIQDVALHVTLPPGSTIVKPLARIGTALGDRAGAWTSISGTELSFTPKRPVGNNAALSIVILFTGGLTP